MPDEQRFVTQFGYGNTNTGGGLDGKAGPFWVDGSLRIEGRLGVSDRTTTMTKTIMRVEETPAWRLSAKTGACRPPGEQTSNWYVGYVEKGATVYYFALQLGATDFGRAYSERVPLARRILTELRILN